MKELEQALKVSANADLLFSELEKASKKLPRKYRFSANKGTFNFDERTLVSPNEKVELWWIIRNFPQNEISASNPQTATGIVVAFVKE